MGAIGFFRFNFIVLAFLASLRLCEIHITGKCGRGQARSYGATIPVGAPHGRDRFFQV